MVTTPTFIEGMLINIYGTFRKYLCKSAVSSLYKHSSGWYKADIDAEFKDLHNGISPQVYCKCVLIQRR